MHVCVCVVTNMCMYPLMYLLVYDSFYGRKHVQLLCMALQSRLDSAHLHTVESHHNESQGTLRIIQYGETSIIRTPLGPWLAVLYSETSIIRTPLGPWLAVLYSETSIIRTPLGPWLAVLYSETSIIRTPLGPWLAVPYMEVSLFRRIQMYTCQCEGLQMGQSSGVLFKEVSAFRKCPLLEVSL